MKIIISPAKKMKESQDSFDYEGNPLFLEQAQKIQAYLRKKTKPELKKILKCNDSLVELNYQRYQNHKQRNTAALMSYVGLQYQHMAPHLFSLEQWEYVKRHLWIGSGLYGILRPQDAINPYRLEMQAKIQIGEARNLYEYWEEFLPSIFKEEELIINLASKEYSDVFMGWYSGKVITVVFTQEVEGELKVKGTLAKMARGAMVRYMAQNQIIDSSELKKFDDLGFEYDDEHSDENTFVFIQKKKLHQDDFTSKM